MLAGSQHLHIEQVMVKLHKKSFSNLNVINDSIEDIVDIFWMEFKNFQTNIFPFDCHGQFSIKDDIAGHSHIWHEMYSLLDT